MYTITITRNSEPVAKVFGRTAYATENAALDYIEDLEDAGYDTTGYDYYFETETDQ